MKVLIAMVAVAALTGCIDSEARIESRAKAQIQSLLYHQQQAQNLVDDMVFVKHERSGLCFAYAKEAGAQAATLTKIDCGIMDVMTGKNEKK
jgi:hypothetical protein